ncbi:MAG: hypothetical protein K8I00_11500, partial [Candidatus Omnitrophica bacterium]|nr:hypothetical protein [Candidatus Omnitrophota bacterium]
VQKVMQHPNRDENFRQNFPGVLRLRQGSGRLYLRVFEEEKTVVILAYHTAGFFKKPGSQSDLSQETKDHLNPVSGSSLQTLEQLQALYALLPVTVDENLAVTKDTPPEAADKSRRDKATLSRADGEVGGIDLNPALLDLQIRRDESGIPLPLPQQPVDNIHIQGIVPIIIQITPVNSLPLLMGFADTPQPVDSAQSSPLAPDNGPRAYDGQDLPQVSLLR